MADFENAVLYVDKHGNAVQTELLRCILNEVSAKATVIDDYLQDQAADGHFPGTVPSVGEQATLARSAVHTAVERRIASERIASERIASERTTSEPVASERITPERTASDIEATCRRLQFLRYLFPDNTNPAVQKALEWLEMSTHGATTPFADNAQSIHLHLMRAWTMKLWGRNEVLPKDAKSLFASVSRLETGTINLRFDASSLAYAGALADERDREAILSQLFTVLDHLNAHDLALVINTLSDSGVDPLHKLIVGAADRLELLQGDDGGFGEEPNRIETTLRALRALLRCERFDSHPFFN